MTTTLTDLSLAQLRDAADLAVTVAAAAEAGIFTGLHAGAATPDELARRLGLDARAVRIVLPVLAELRLVEVDGSRWSLTERGRAELGDTASPRYAARGLPFWLANLRRWSHLPTVLRTGKPVPPEVEPEDPVEAYMAGMLAVPAARVRRTVEEVRARHPEARTALDVGGGPGVYARALAAAGLEVTLLDTPEVIAFGMEACGLADEPRIRLARGDFLADPLPAGPFDAVLLSNVVHLFSPEVARALLRKVAGVTAPGGLVVLGETVMGRSPRAGRMGLLMLLRTEGGEAYGEEELRAWLEEAGFEEVQTEDVEPERQIVTARRRSDDPITEGR